MTYFLCLGCFCLGILYDHFRPMIHYYFKYFWYIITHWKQVRASSIYNEFTETNISDLDYEDLNGKLDSSKKDGDSNVVKLT